MKIRLDVIAKGYIADKDARMVCPADIRDFLFNAEGEIVADGDKKNRLWRIVVETLENIAAIPCIPPSAIE